MSAPVALSAAIRESHTAAEAAIAMSEYGGAEDTRTADRASKAALEHALKLAAELEAERDRAHAAIRKASRALRWMGGTYCVGPGNWERVIDLYLTDAANVANELEREAGL